MKNQKKTTTVLSNGEGKGGEERSAHTLSKSSEPDETPWETLVNDRNANDKPVQRGGQTKITFFNRPDQGKGFDHGKKKTR